MGIMKVYENLKIVSDTAWRTFFGKLDEGITAIIVNNGRILVMKRIWMPFIIHSGFWNFVGGIKERNESYDDAAYKEVFEETGLKKRELRILSKYKKVMILDNRNGAKYSNCLYVFRSKTRRIRLNFENTDYKWITLSDIRNGKNYVNVFADESLILKVISKALQKGK